ncbi:hypothetical protein AB0B25_04520 [Nocardia sp. NPDC049190]|uniref:hypothetical protein n=1 Tax=Nocardia sp. NPDC049190 TaxID=3155650 RepID=UPI0033F2FFB7
MATTLTFVVDHTPRLSQISAPRPDSAPRPAHSATGGVDIDRVTGPTRLLGMLVLLAGIIAMHSAVFTVSCHTRAASAHGTTIADDVSGPMSPSGSHTRIAGGPWHAAAIVGDVMSTARAAGIGVATSAARATGIGVAADADRAGDGCGSAHGGMHGCVFVLVAVTALFALVVLYRMAVDEAAGGALPRHWRPRRERPPPWTVPTLAELAILRI